MLKINSLLMKQRRGIVRTGVDFNSFRNTDQKGKASLKREHPRTEEGEEGTNVVIWGRGGKLKEQV